MPRIASYGVYYWFGSQLTGWDCSDNMVVTATDLHGPLERFQAIHAGGIAYLSVPVPE